MNKAIIEALKTGKFCPKQFKIFKNGKGRKVYIKEEYRTESVEAIRSPSHRWPFSEFKHAFTKKYQKQLLEKLTNE